MNKNINNVDKTNVPKNNGCKEEENKKNKREDQTIHQDIIQHIFKSGIERNCDYAQMRENDG